MENHAQTRGSKISQRPYAIAGGMDGTNGIQATRILAGDEVPVIAITEDPKPYGSPTEIISFTETTSEVLTEALENVSKRVPASTPSPWKMIRAVSYTPRRESVPMAS